MKTISSTGNITIDMKHNRLDNIKTLNKELQIDVFHTYVFFDFVRETRKIEDATEFPCVLWGNSLDKCKQYI